jgi:very-short-patch-repair endonuclease
MPYQRDHSRRLLGFARRMRKEPTDAERKLWLLLRSRRLSGFKFRRQFPAAGYVLDYYCIKAKLALELDGGQHSDPQQLKYDDKRTEKLAEIGIRVLRFDDRTMLKEPKVVSDTIYRELTGEPP